MRQNTSIQTLKITFQINAVMSEYVGIYCA